MSLPQYPEPSVTSPNDRHAVVPAPESSRSIARGSDAQALTPRSLEERRLIHRNDSVRIQADAFRDLRTRLLTLGGSQNFVTLIVPVTPGCGGSFVARNLAAAFAFDETKTSLLVDCDALYPSQHSALGVDANAGGLMDYLEDSVGDIADIQYRTGIPRMYLIPSGHARETTGEYFSSLRARTMVDSLRSNHPNRYLILDSPSALKSPDARILSDLADLVVLVAGYGKVTLENIDKAAANFDPEKLAGVVFNDVN